MKKLPIKSKPPVQQEESPAPRAKRSKKPELEELKAMSNAEKMALCLRLGLSTPRYEEGAKDHIVHMHLLHILKLHFGYAGDKPKNVVGRRPSKPTTLAIHESNAALKGITLRLDNLTRLVEKLLK
jgi:hypothetical protein